MSGNFAPPAFAIEGDGSGEINTGSNVGSIGVGVYDSKSGVQLRFRNIAVASEKLTVDFDATNKNINLDLGTVAISDITGLQTELDSKLESGDVTLSGLGGISLASLSGVAPIVYDDESGEFSLAADFNGNTLCNFTTAINTQTGTSYTLQLADRGKILEFSNTSPITLTLPNSLPVGFSCTIVQINTGQASLALQAGAVLRHRQNHTKLAGQWAEVSLYIRSNSGSNAEYVFAGDTTA